VTREQRLAMIRAGHRRWLLAEERVERVMALSAAHADPLDVDAVPAEADLHTLRRLAMDAFESMKGWVL